MKSFAVLLLLSASLLAADIDYVSPLDLLKRDDELALSDGSSYFVFAKDGTFRSFPVGMSGRELTGKWTSKETNPTFVTATAKVGWMNGFQPPEDYRKIVFVIYGGTTEPNKSPLRGDIKNIYRGYFIIDEFTKTSNPN